MSDYFYKFYYLFNNQLSKNICPYCAFYLPEIKSINAICWSDITVKGPYMFHKIDLNHILYITVWIYTIFLDLINTSPLAD